MPGRAAREAEFAAFLAARTPALLRFAYLLTGDRDRAEMVLRSACASAYRRRERPDAANAEDEVRRAVLERVIGRSVGARSSRLASWRAGRAGRSAPAVAAEGARGGPLATGATGASDGSDPPDAGWDLLATLTPAERAAVVLRHAEGFEERSVRELLGVSPAAVVRGLGVDEALLRDTLRDPARSLAAPAAPWRGVRESARRSRRRRLAVTGAALAVAAGLLVVPALGGGDAPDRARPTRFSPPPPPPGQGLLDWAPRGGLSTDKGFVEDATAAWRRSTRAAHQPGPQVYVVWAGRLGAGRLALLQARGLDGRAQLAQVAQRGKLLELAAEQELTDPAVPALAVNYDGNLDGALGLSPGAGASIMQLLLSPLQAAAAAVEAAEAQVWVRVPRRDPATPIPWRERPVQGDLTRGWLQLDARDATVRLSRRLSQPTTAGELPYAVRTITVAAHRLLPVSSQLQQLPDAVATAPDRLLAPPGVRDDALAVQPQPMPARTVRALAVHEEGSGLRVSLLELGVARGAPRLAFVLRREEQGVRCRSVRALTAPVLTSGAVVGGGCADGRSLWVAAWAPPAARTVRVDVATARGASGSYLVEPGSVTRYRVDSQLRRLTFTAVDDRGGMLGRFAADLEPLTAS